MKENGTLAPVSGLYCFAPHCRADNPQVPCPGSPLASKHSIVEVPSLPQVQWESSPSAAVCSAGATVRSNCAGGPRRERAQGCTDTLVQSGERGALVGGAEWRLMHWLLLLDKLFSSAVPQ